MITTEKKGFTLIEILIVVAIIAILASIVLVGLGPTQQSGRDARRLSDLHEVQNALELYYNKCGYYPGQAGSGGSCTAGAPSAGWSGSASLSNDLVTSGVVPSQLPTDPSANRTYAYYTNGNTDYVLGAALENANNSALVGYNPPSDVGSAWSSKDGVTIYPAPSCTGTPSGSGASGATYCITL